MKLSFNLQNKLNQTPLSPKKCLVPLFEAIANSINAIEEAGIVNGTITVSVIRDQTQAALSPDILPNQPVTGFVIEDNGIGFNDENLASFCEAYTDRKKAQGGRPLPKFDVTPFYAYIICDITPNLRRFMTDHEFIGAPDEEIFYRYNHAHKVYIEVLSFNKLLNDSKKRNNAFFEKLNLHMDPPSAGPVSVQASESSWG